MVLTNAERQARFRRRLHERATTAVTPDMVVKAAKLFFEHWARENCATERELPTWEKHLADARKRRGVDSWREWIPADPEEDYSEFGNDAPMMRAVALVAAAVLFPPRS
ncbi:MAG: hypothetical protein ABIO85_10085 [Sphingomicrobium sp.]